MRGVMIVNGYHRHLAPRHTDELISTICRHANLKVYATEFRDMDATWLLVQLTAEQMWSLRLAATARSTRLSTV